MNSIHVLYTQLAPQYGMLIWDQQIRPSRSGGRVMVDRWIYDTSDCHRGPKFVCCSLSLFFWVTAPIAPVTNRTLVHFTLHIRSKSLFRPSDIVLFLPALNCHADPSCSLLFLTAPRLSLPEVLLVFSIPIYNETYVVFLARCRRCAVYSQQAHGFHCARGGEDVP